MNENIEIDGVKYKKLEIINIKIDGENKDKITEEDAQKLNDVTVNITVKTN